MFNVKFILQRNNAVGLYKRLFSTVHTDLSS